MVVQITTLPFFILHYSLYIKKMLYYFLALLTGAAVSVQSGVNSQLRQGLGNPVFAALISFGTGFLSLILFQSIMRGPAPALEALRTLDWWKWTGGLLGAVYVTTVIVVIPRIGAASMLSLSVAGQLIAAVLLDHYGWLGFQQHSASLWRLVGVTMIILGAVIVVKN